ncbi:MAG: hypothetical protein KatS3mg099_420 [Candidatus Parcubacteria bacterium]|nr:MAG: hypothetical protein KatS3mg099_420 [Candidatus Parcubacteria bacterium]
MLFSSVARAASRVASPEQWIALARLADAALESVFPWREPLASRLQARGLLPCPETPARWVAASVPFSNPSVRHMVHALKFGGSWEAAALGGHLLAARLRRCERWWRAHQKTICLVPVPLSPARQEERGFNQAERLAFWLLVSLWKEVPFLARRVVCGNRLLARTRNTLQQSLLRDAALRKANVRGAFAVRGKADPNTVYILIDDVATTGATLRECRRVLRAFGARSVKALVLAA